MSIARGNNAIKKKLVGPAARARRRRMRGITGDLAFHIEGSAIDGGILTAQKGTDRLYLSSQ
jgi:hypothetical protein